MTIQTSKRIPELDGIRGVAISIILVWHYVNNQLYYSNYEAVNFIITATRTLWSGVDLFFVLSGYLIGGILLRNKTSGKYFKTFYIRRAYRILPLYYLILVCYVVMNFVIPNLNSIPYLASGEIPVWSYAVFIQNYFMIAEESFGSGWLTVTWSLAIEEQFYMLLPLLIYFLNRKYVTISVVCLIILAVIFRYLNSNWFVEYLSFPCRMDALFSGVLIAIMFEKESIVNFLRSKRSAINAIFLILSALMIYVTLGSSINNFYFLNYSLFILFYSTLLIISLLFKDSVIARIMRNGVLRKLGEISYGIYLYHLIVIYVLLWLFNELGLSRVNNVNVMIVAFISLGVTYAISYLSYHYFERKLMRIGHKYTY